MKLSEYCQYDGLGLAELVRKKEVTSQDLVDCALKAIEKVNPSLNAVMNTIPEDLRAEDGASGQFAGVPFLIKDVLIHMKGVKSESCSALLEGVVSEYDSDLMTRYRQAGLVTVGRTATPEFGYNATTESRFNGPTRNPWDISKMAGGSSGGSSAAVAAGVVPMAHANDGGGSIRIPAACCGLVGMKPTRGRTPIGPDYGEALSGLGIEHAVTRTVRDSAALLDISEGPGVGDAFQIARPGKSYLSEVTTAPGKLKIAWTAESWGNGPVDSDVVSALEDTVRLLGDLGHTLENNRPEFDTESFWVATSDIWAANLSLWVSASAELLGKDITPDLVEKSIMACYEHGKSMSAPQFIAAMGVMNQVTRTVAPFFETYDILATPVMARAPQDLGYLNADQDGWTAQSWTNHIFDFAPFTPLFNTTGQPAISLPLGQSPEGLPIGIQFVAAYGKEDLLFRLAGQLEEAAPWAGRRPTVFASV
ncbi:MAG: amidase [Alphaproteobacteria bacterium]|nr:MAG: amidase [Alphaproteobacteria bacterium]